MGKFLLTEELLLQYQKHLYEEERATATIKKYICDLKKLKDYASGREITKELMVRYKEELRKKYKVTSINSFLVAANRFFEYAGWYGLRIKTYRIQKEIFVPENRNLSKAEYKRLVKLALRKGKKRLAMMLQTICATGIRISELASFTAESVKITLFPAPAREGSGRARSKSLGQGCLSGGKPFSKGVPRVD